MVWGAGGVSGLMGCVVGWGWVVLGVEVVVGEIVVDWEGEGLGVVVRMKGWVSAGSWDGATSEVGWVLLLVVGDRWGLWSGVRMEVLFVAVARILSRFLQAYRPAHVLYSFAGQYPCQN